MSRLQVHSLLKIIWKNEVTMSQKGLTKSKSIIFVCSKIGYHWQLNTLVRKSQWKLNLY